MIRPPRMRPTFEIVLDGPNSEILTRLQRSIEDEDSHLVGQFVTGHAMIKLVRERRSLLSPVLNLETIRQGDEFVLRGRFSPQPNVWTGFMFVYGVLAMTGLAGLMYGFAKLTVDESPLAMLAAPICGALIAFVYGASVIGQGLTVDDMYEMRTFVNEVAAAER